MTKTRAESVEIKVLRSAGLKAVAACASNSPDPLRIQVRKELSDAHKYGMIRAAVPVLHLLLLRNETVDLAYIGARLAGMHAKSDSSELEIRSRLTRVLSSGFGGHAGGRTFEGEGYHGDQPTHEFVAWLREIRRRLRIKKGAIGFIPIAGSLICGAIDLRTARRMAIASKES